MLKLIKSALAAACLFSTTVAQASICGDRVEMWQIVEDDTRYVTYRPNESMSYGPVIFESYSQSGLSWRIQGVYGCSNGIVVCSISIPTNGEPIEASETVIYEGEVPQYLVYADLLQSSAYRQIQAQETIRAEIFSDQPASGMNPQTVEPAAGEPLRIPSYYRFAGCRDRTEAFD
ncbi:hypothetical protein LUX29_11015 [Aureimonas altamirensis]|uniref:hypothetical protein n=1 Tax=Aureimonas altamirensis TaxID=370622 RepID=UPI001E6551DD|nr:hypothetical protein [Aureimonas altamirensis]UHD47647.1 hypothetical protein LUX29_11015 [Aureimonas altamirensis]